MQALNLIGVSRVRVLLQSLAIGVCLSIGSATSIGRQDTSAGWTLEGIVVDGRTKQALSGVRVEIQGSKNSIQTDTAGHFFVSGPPLGNALLLGERTGYVSLRLRGSQVVGNAGIPLFLGSGVRLNEVFSMFSAGIVSGRVLGSRGEPIRGVTATLFHFTFSEAGTRLPLPFTSIKTNDRGEFRLIGVEPGEYVLRLEPSSVASSQGTERAVFPVYYPDRISLSQAQTIRVDSGLEVDMGTIVLLPLRTSQLNLRVLTERGQPTDGSFSLRFVGDVNPVRSGVIPANGARMELPSGLYDLIVYSRRGTQPASTVRQYLTVNLTGSEANLDVPIPPLSKLVAHVSLLAGKTITALPGVGIKLVDQATRSPAAITQDNPLDRSMTGMSDSRGYFSVQNIVPGRYRFDVTGVPRNTYLFAILDRDGRDLVMNGLELRGGEEPEIEFQFRESTSFVKGTVTDSQGRAVPHAVVALIPDDRNQQHLFVSLKADARGLFELAGAPGAYSLFAWRELNGSAFRNLEFMASANSVGKPIQLQEAQNVTVDIVLVTDLSR